MTEHIHTIAVDKSLTPIQAWQELLFWGHRVTAISDVVRWANIECDGEECYTIQEVTNE